MRKVIAYAALLIPACLPQFACTPAQLEKLDTVVNSAATECDAANAEYEAAKVEYAEHRKLADVSCAVAKLLPEQVGEVSTTPLRAGCEASRLDAAAARVDATMQRLARVCFAVRALGVPQ